LQFTPVVADQLLKKEKPTAAAERDSNPLHLSAHGTDREAD